MGFHKVRPVNCVASSQGMAPWQLPDSSAALRRNSAPVRVGYTCLVVDGKLTIE